VLRLEQSRQQPLLAFELCSSYEDMTRFSGEERSVAAEYAVAQSSPRKNPLLPLLPTLDLLSTTKISQAQVVCLTL
jgi:hypothetical protein